MTKEGVGRKPDVSTSLPPHQRGVDRLRVKREWRAPKIEKLPVRETLFGTSPGIDGAGFSPTLS
jgi:hypothetical protein